MSDEITDILMLAMSLMGNIKEGDMDYSDVKTPCSTCKHARGIPGDSHTRCSKPSLTISAKRHGVDNGWFMYPVNFDPIWRTGECDNYGEK